MGFMRIIIRLKRGILGRTSESQSSEAVRPSLYSQAVRPSWSFPGRLGLSQAVRPSTCSFVEWDGSERIGTGRT